MELVLICIALFLGKSSQQLNSEELDDILDKLINQIKSNNTLEVTNASENKTDRDELIDRSPEESKIIYLKTYNKPVIDFIPDNVSDKSQEYSKIPDNLSQLGGSQNISETNENEIEFILQEIESLSDNISAAKDEDVERSTNKPEVVIIKPYNNNTILRDVHNNASDLIIIPVETQDTRRKYDNLSLPDEILNLIKENKGRGIILKEIVVEIQHNAQNNTTTDVVHQSMTSKPELKEKKEDIINIINDTTLSDITTERSKKVTAKISGNKRNQKKPSKVKNRTKDSKKQHQIDSYLTDRTVPLELKQEQYKGLNLNIPQISDVNMLPTPNRIENLEPRPFLWRSSLPKARRCNENCVLRKLFRNNNLYPTIMSRSPHIIPSAVISQSIKPIIVPPRSAKFQIDRALQNMYSMSTSQNGPTYYITDVMNRIWARKIYQPSYNRFVYL